MEQMETLVMTLSSNMEQVTQRISTLGDRPPATPVNTKHAQIDLTLTPKSQDLAKFFKIPDGKSSPMERELFFVQSKMSMEQLVSQDRNKHEMASIFRTIRVLLDGPLDSTARKAIMTLMVRAKELTLMESSGIKFATTFANHIHFDSESNIISAAHNAALLADRKGSSSKQPTNNKNGKRTHRRSRDSDGGKAAAPSKKA
jgi:hypothetical protein